MYIALYNLTAFFTVCDGSNYDVIFSLINRRVYVYVQVTLQSSGTLPVAREPAIFWHWETESKQLNVWYQLNLTSTQSGTLSGRMQQKTEYIIKLGAYEMQNSQIQYIQNQNYRLQVHNLTAKIRDWNNNSSFISNSSNYRLGKMYHIVLML